MRISRCCNRLCSVLPVQYEEKEGKEPRFQNHPLAFFPCWEGSLGILGPRLTPPRSPFLNELTAVFSFPRGEAETGCHDMSLGTSVREAWVGGARSTLFRNHSSATPAINRYNDIFIMRDLGAELGIGVPGCYRTLNIFVCILFPSPRGEGFLTLGVWDGGYRGERSPVHDWSGGQRTNRVTSGLLLRSKRVVSLGEGFLGEFNVYPNDLGVRLLLDGHKIPGDRGGHEASLVPEIDILDRSQVRPGQVMTRRELNLNTISIVHTCATQPQSQHLGSSPPPFDQNAFIVGPT